MNTVEFSFSVTLKTFSQVCFHEWRPVDKKNTAVNSLVFHTSQVPNLNI